MGLQANHFHSCVPPPPISPLPCAASVQRLRTQMDLDLQAWERRAESALGGGGNNSGGEGSSGGGGGGGGGSNSGVEGSNSGVEGSGGSRGHFRSGMDSMLRRAEEEAGRAEARGRTLGEAAEMHVAKAVDLLGQVEVVR